ncbi:DUF4157 domain-containing protein [Flavihumibacter sp. CACIAM 22H1]|uniref:eCIS core domain-containing protein n=1 Tax=Flavihumibacter sp. CACIAM 22H1 TaxID=1812911 RepID=UPI0007A833DA|nr:DUF4157 domain-containing protein [Flavihumibacter sp. CACIAM 22H1]KYP14800.1 MAG: hypothetical protein A1D16_06455 [Flavihumibacter sp. CACIAM 22H1]
MSDVYHIKENSIWAKLAAKRMKAEKLAMVLGNTIHLHNTSYQEMLQNRRWLRHELAHVQQFQHYGWVRFLLLYLVESIKRGYYNNRFEVEAREAEQDFSLEQRYTFQPRWGQESQVA